MAKICYLVLPGMSKENRGDFDSVVRQIPDPAGAEHAISKNMMVWTFGE